ncbi:MAG: hypothetical protein M3M96_09740 [Candidatus Eremiobacteraeota bacterium]|nr:hypothetical protein [Candidatus Eremiobacteraeota bacterium]
MARSTYTPAEAAADLAHYQRMKRSVSLRSLLVVVPFALLLAHWSLWFALALLVGGTCGVANALLAMHGNERLLDRRSVGAFVISSFVRIGLFGIVPVVLVIESGSPWSLGLYFTGFFTPLGLYAAGLRARW